MERKIKLSLVVTQLNLLLPVYVAIASFGYAAFMLGLENALEAFLASFLLLLFEYPAIRRQQEEYLQREWQDYVPIPTEEVSRTRDAVDRLLPGKVQPRLFLIKDFTGYMGVCASRNRKEKWIAIAHVAVDKLPSGQFDALVAHELSHMTLRHNELRKLAYLIFGWLLIFQWVLVVTTIVDVFTGKLQPLPSAATLAFLFLYRKFTKRLVATEWTVKAEYLAWLNAITLAGKENVYCYLSRFATPVELTVVVEGEVVDKASGGDMHWHILKRLQALEKEGERGRESA
jgi:Zn-dependent protease with chaperone function